MSFTITTYNVTPWKKKKTERMSANMKYVFLFLLAITLPLNASAQTTLKDCFAKENDSAISICLTQVYEELEGTRKIIENDIRDMISNDILMPPPEAEITAEEDFSLSVHDSKIKNPETPEEKRAQRNLEQALHNIREKKAKEAAARKNRMAAEHLLTKRRLLNDHQASEKLFTEYRDKQCELRKLGAENNNNLFDAVFVYKLCLHEMTQMRIEHLQKTIKP